MKKIQTHVKKQFHKLKRIKNTPHQIALGFAVGTFFAILPTFWTGLLLAIITLAIYKKMSKVAVFVAFGLWNPITKIILQPFAWFIGSLLLTGRPIDTTDLATLENLKNVTLHYITGMSILATIIGIISYGVALTAVKAYLKTKPSLTHLDKKA